MDLVLLITNNQTLLANRYLCELAMCIADLISFVLAMFGDPTKHGIPSFPYMPRNIGAWKERIAREGPAHTLSK